MAIIGKTYDGASHFANNTDFEVQRANHFEVVLDLRKIIDESTAQHIRLSTKSISVPKITSEAVQLKHGNETVKVASAPTFEDLNLTVYDTLGKDQLDIMQKWFDKVFNHNDPNRLMGRVVDYKCDGVLYMYSPNGEICRKWIIQGVWPREIGQSTDFSFDSTEVQNITVALSVDRYWEVTNGK